MALDGRDEVFGAPGVGPGATCASCGDVLGTAGRPGAAHAGGPVPSPAEASIDRSRTDVPGFEEFLDRWSAAHGHHEPRSSTFVHGWLSLIHPLARPLARRRVPPTRITVVGGVCGVAVAGVSALGGHWVLLAVALVLLVAVLDALDGAVAVLTGTASAWGRVVDPLTDRLGDLAFVVSLGLLGAPWALCAAAGALALLQESVRATATAAGMDDIGVVTVSERPTRVIVAVISLVAAGVVPVNAAFSATAGAVVGTVLGAIGTVQLLVVVRRRLGPGAPATSGPS